MFILFCIIIIVACVLLTLVVLIQNPKGGGIASNFTAPNQIMGARRSTDVVEKTTWILALVLISFSLLSNFFRPTGVTETGGSESRLKDNIENAAVPAAPNQIPAQQDQNADQQPEGAAMSPEAQPAQPQPEEVK
jgi:preprotein translocase subunit SecG